MNTLKVGFLSLPGLLCPTWRDMLRKFNNCFNRTLAGQLSRYVFDIGRFGSPGQGHQPTLLRSFGRRAIRAISIRISDNAFPESTVSRSRRMLCARFAICVSLSENQSNCAGVDR
jgi:hypothetical protein